MLSKFPNTQHELKCCRRAQQQGVLQPIKCLWFLIFNLIYKKYKIQETMAATSCNQHWKNTRTISKTQFNSTWSLLCTNPNSVVAPTSRTTVFYFVRIGVEVVWCMPKIFLISRVCCIQVLCMGISNVYKKFKWLLYNWLNWWIF